MLKRPTVDAPGIKNKFQSSESDGAGIKNPTYKGRTKTGEADLIRPNIPKGVKIGGKIAAKGGGYGPGGRFGRGGWQASGQRMKKNFLAKTPEQEEESQRKQMMKKAKQRAVKNRLSSLKKGPNEKQNQLLGGE